MEAKVRKSNSERQGFLAILSKKGAIFIKKGLKSGNFGPFLKKIHIGVFTYSFTLSRYSPVLVFMRINSPSLTNKGTLTVAPVSMVAGFNVRVAVSPRNPGSV